MNQKLIFKSVHMDYRDGSPYRTVVTLGNDESSISVFFDTEAINKNTGELEKLALDTLYSVNFPDKAIVDGLKEINDRLAKTEATRIVKDNREAFTKNLADGEAKLQTVNGTVVRKVKQELAKDPNATFTTAQLVELFEAILTTGQTTSHMTREAINYLP